MLVLLPNSRCISAAMTAAEACAFVATANHVCRDLVRWTFCCFFCAGQELMSEVGGVVRGVGGRAAAYVAADARDLTSIARHQQPPAPQSALV
jgi:hypothetical protein